MNLLLEQFPTSPRRHTGRASDTSKTVDTHFDNHAAVFPEG